MRVINIAKDYTRFPSGRFLRNGNTSGEGFRLKLLVPALSGGDRVKVELDGTIGYGSSFLEEAFGGLVRQLQSAPDELLSRLELVSRDASLIAEVKQYIRDAAATSAKQ
jgi:hypothetical protein